MSDPESVIHVLREENRALRQQIESLTSTLARLSDQIAWFQRQMFGQKSERLVPLSSQPDLFGHEIPPLHTLPEKVLPERQVVAAGHGRQEIPEHLPRETVLLDLTPEEKLCPCCGGDRICIGEDLSEQLGIAKPRLFVRRTVRRKYACRTCTEEGVKTPPAPENFIAKGLAGLDLVLWVVLSKHLDHLPLHRIKSQLKRWGNGLEIAESTMVGWIAMVFELLGPIQRALEHEIRMTGWMHADETTLRVQREEKDKLGRGKTSICQLWATLGRLPGGEPVGVSFRYDPSRSAATAYQVLQGFQGLLLADGLSSYDTALAHPTMRGRVIRAHCWAHARRGFSDALDLGESRARHPLELIARIYRAEKECQEALDGAWDRRGEELLALCEQKVKPLIEALFQWAEEQAMDALPKERLGKAVGYLLNHAEGLKMCLCHAGCDLDNNIIERAIRPVAIGRPGSSRIRRRRRTPRLPALSGRHVQDAGPRCRSLPRRRADGVQAPAGPQGPRARGPHALPVGCGERSSGRIALKENPVKRDSPKGYAAGAIRGGHPLGRRLQFSPVSAPDRPFDCIPSRASRRKDS